MHDTTGHDEQFVGDDVLRPRTHRIIDGEVVDERLAAARKDAAREQVLTKQKMFERDGGRRYRRHIRRVDAANAGAVEVAKRHSVLLPSAREVFAVRPRRPIDGVMTTVGWPPIPAGVDVASWMHARLQAAGLR